MTERGTESECAHCGATDAPEDGVIIGIGDEIGTSTCTVCLTERYQTDTVLSRRESQVAAHKHITGAANATIPDRPNLETSTVDEYPRRGKAKCDAAMRTVELLDWC